LKAAPRRIIIEDDDDSTTTRLHKAIEIKKKEEDGRCCVVRSIKEVLYWQVSMEFVFCFARGKRIKMKNEEGWMMSEISPLLFILHIIY
jgi:hypothetical protein